MSKGDSEGGFLARVARLVSPSAGKAPHGPASGEEDAPLDRQALKAARERKRRNDQVRRREFDFLRDLLYRKRAQQLGQEQSSFTDVASSLSSQDGVKAQTIEKIARIEAQMSQNWLHRQGFTDQDAAAHKIAAPPVPRGRLDGGLTEPAHLQARTAQLPIDLVGEEVHEPGDAAVGVPSPALNDAAVLFAKGDDSGAERALRALMAQEVSGAQARTAWLALLDLCHARGEVTRFEDLAAEYADRFHCAMPHWPTPEEAAIPVSAEVSGAPAPGVAVVWHCPALLGKADIEQLQGLVAGSTGPYWFDWSDLVSAELLAAETLLSWVQLWLQQPLVFRFRGGGVLRRRLKASTPSGRRENEAIWWQLRLALLRLMGRYEEFDLAALDYCVTYGVLPPNWEPPLCACEPTEALPGGSAAEVVEPALRAGDPSLVLDWPPMVAAAQAEPAVPGGPALSGAWQGDLAPALAGLDQVLTTHPRHQVFAVDCLQLKRMDFVAASALMQWLLSVLGRGTRVELRQVNRLVAAFFHVVGIDGLVTVRLRQY